MIARIVLIHCLLLSTSIIAADDNRLLWQQGQDDFQQGRFAQAIEKWESALSQAQLSDEQRIEILIHLAMTYQIAGDYTKALTILQEALPLAESKGKPQQRLLLRSHLGDVLLAMQQPEAAQKYLEDNLKLARELNEPLVLAHLLNNLGNALVVQQAYPGALKHYEEAASLAEQGNDLLLQIKALSNQIPLYIKLEDAPASTTVLTTILPLIQKLPIDYNKVFQLLGLGQLALQIQKQFPQSQQVTNAYQLLNEALSLAQHHHYNRLTAYAKGFLAEAYELVGRYQEASHLTREAIFLSQGMPDLLYLWEWQRGRLLKNQGELVEATQAYQQAVDYLRPIQTGLLTGQRDAREVFRERIRPVYFGLADVLLRRAAATSVTEEKAELLKQARQRLELLKAAELQEYFQDECVTAAQNRVTVNIENYVVEQTAVLYPILLPERTVLLLSDPGGVRQIVVPIDIKTLEQTIHAFRRNLQTSTSNRFIKQSKQLYEWLIAPLEEQLNKYDIHTLIIVPDGALRTIPLAALYNAKGKHFLFQHFALVTTPGLDLTDPRPLPRQNVNVLLSGLSEGVQNFTPLPNVPSEISNIRTLFNQNTVLLDRAFSLNTLDRILKDIPYSIVHIASHGQFDRDPKKTFILTYDDKLTMDRLERLLGFSQLRQEPVELLTLSACQTAVGDDRAALGLAGVAIKAGARSALASLWFVSDEATSQLVAEFYQQLQDPTLSKAQSLQNAQKKLIEERQFRHPAYWAPFLLIGNWL